MKKRLSVLLIGSLVALSLAGCSGANTPSETSSVPGESTTESSVQSAETSTENSKTDGVSENEKNAENSADESKNEENSGESTEQPEVTVSDGRPIFCTSCGSKKIEPCRFLKSVKELVYVPLNS